MRIVVKCWGESYSDWIGWFAGIILWMGSANERRRYYVMPSLIGRADTQNDNWVGI